jgi:hypothetical protein
MDLQQTIRKTKEERKESYFSRFDLRFFNCPDTSSISFRSLSIDRCKGASIINNSFREASTPFSSNSTESCSYTTRRGKKQEPRQKE